MATLKIALVQMAQVDDPKAYDKGRQLQHAADLIRSAPEADLPAAWSKARPRSCAPTSNTVQWLHRLMFDFALERLCMTCWTEDHACFAVQNLLDGENSKVGLKPTAVTSGLKQHVTHVFFTLASGDGFANDVPLTPKRMMAEMEDEEMALIEESKQMTAGRKTSWALALILSTFAVAGLWVAPAASQALGKKQSEFIQESPQGKVTIELNNKVRGQGAQARRDLNDGFTTGSNTNKGNQAGRDINNNYYGNISPDMAASDPMAPCKVKTATKAKVTYEDGGFILYSDPEHFRGSFFDKESNPITDVKDLPRCLEKLWLLDPQLGGNVNDLPKTLTNLSLPGSLTAFKTGTGAQLTGDAKNLPRLLKYLDLHWTSRNITGFTSDLPRDLDYLDVYQNNKITGELLDLPRNLTYMNFFYNENITGYLSDLPKSLRIVKFFFNKKITGALVDLPRGLTHVEFDHTEKIFGSLADLPKGLTFVDFDRSEKIFGTLADLPKGVTEVNLDANNKITGNLADLPKGLTQMGFIHNKWIFGTLADLQKRIRGSSCHRTSDTGFYCVSDEYHFPKSVLLQTENKRNDPGQRMSSKAWRRPPRADLCMESSVVPGEHATASGVPKAEAS
eukprot:Skav234207  [mRNA]  locus=scaffold2795:96819:101628:- [translate_table: standard]